jgi:hypothetical protein
VCQYFLHQVVSQISGTARLYFVALAVHALFHTQALDPPPVAEADLLKFLHALLESVPGC